MVVMVLTAVFADLLQSHDPIATNAAYTSGNPTPSTGSAPITWAATSTRVSSTARGVAHRGPRVDAPRLGARRTRRAASGYIGGTTDLVAQRVLDILQGLPLLVLALVMSAALGRPSTTW